jgi:glutathione S-transferase
VPAAKEDELLMSNDLKLYHSAASPNSRRFRIFLAEKGIAIPLAPVDLAKGEQHSDAYRAINPRRVVPTLVLEDGTAIGEVPAIWRYLEELEGFAAVMEGVRNAAERLKGRAIAGPHDYDQIPALAQQASGEKLLRRHRYPSGGSPLCRRQHVLGGRYHRIGNCRFCDQSHEFFGAR